MGKRRKEGGQEVDAEERTFNRSTLTDHPLVSHGNQCIQSKESQGCECDMVSLMKDEHLLQKKSYPTLIPSSMSVGAT